jgi:hypothetical protein
MARRKKVEAYSKVDIEAALEELKQDFERLMANQIEIECGCGWAGSIEETFNDNGECTCPECGNGLIFTEEMEMATAKTVSKLSDKLVKVGESFTINMYDNGYMIEVSGRNKKTDWVTAKIMVGSVDDLVSLVREAADMERDS